VDFAAERENIDSDFLVALFTTESVFDIYAVSSKGYHGVAQIAYKIYDPDTNMLIGAKEFNKKLRLAKGNTIKAIILYKGYGKAEDYERGKKQAEKVMALYHRLQKMEVKNEPI
jgi:soluble lytic murein transglycosylase-like protein